MSIKKSSIILIDLPTFPKGVLSLSLISIANFLSEKFDVQIVDLNFMPYSEYTPPLKSVLMFGLKVSSQNYKQAVTLSQKIKKINPQAIIVWGGELPTLMPDLCLNIADTVFCGLFEPTAEVFIQDLETNNLKPKYTGGIVANYPIAVPNFEFIKNIERYYQFIGYPLETSRGCTEKCIFCMVHVMQKTQYKTEPIEILKKHIHKYKGKFINIVDYNFGVNTEHVIAVARLIKESEATGWMAEMCIELLNNDEILEALKNSRCKMIYCGLESIEQTSINSVHKMNTNQIENYEQIIRKVQSYGIQIAAGIIVGMEHSHQKTFENLFEFYHRMGIIYAKLTYLTYNPGTRVHEYVKKKGSYVTEDICAFDGNQLTYLPNGVAAKHINDGLTKFIQSFYSVRGIVRRSFNTSLTFWGRVEYVTFALCYRQTYIDWLKYDTINNPRNIISLIEQPFRKSIYLQLFEKILHWVRQLQTVSHI